MKIQKQFHKLSKNEFDKYLEGLKSAPDTLFVLQQTKSPCFYCLMRETIALLSELRSKQEELDSLYKSFHEFGQKQLLQSFFINEVESTNEIESIYSTRHDIFAAMNKVRGVTDKKVVSIVSSYALLLTHNYDKLRSLNDIRNIYDSLILPSLDKKDKPDGKYFRKDEVYITDGIKIVHRGINGEENIEKAMSEFLSIYNSDLDIFEKMILCHFIFESVHPYYDGNGRMGRFLFSYGICRESGSISAYKVASAFARNKNKYYAAFKNVGAKHEFGCLNAFVEDIAQLLIDELNRTIKDIACKKEQIDNAKQRFELTKSQKVIYDLLLEGSVLSDFGLSNTELQEETKLSKASIDKAIKRFKELDILASTRIGYYIFHRVSIKKDNM